MNCDVDELACMLNNMDGPMTAMIMSRKKYEWSKGSISSREVFQVQGVTWNRESEI
jgi:hypothetical protein